MERDGVVNERSDCRANGECDAWQEKCVALANVSDAHYARVCV